MYLGAMKPVLGFIIVTYAQPLQTLHLCRRLGEMFGDPPIAIHHDFSQCDLDLSAFPPFVRFVERWVRTGWGTISVVDAQLAAMRLLFDTAAPDWCINLSSADYPIQTGEQILRDLQGAEADAFFMLRRVQDQGQRFVNEGLGELAFDHPRYSQSAFNRYVALPLLSPKTARRLRQPNETWVLRSKFLINTFTPFGSERLQCFGGDAWYTISRRVAYIVMDQTPFWTCLYDHYKKRSLPEESFFHTILGNTPDLRLNDNNLRYADWRGCYAHPRTLGHSDIPMLLQSTDHFARKLPFDVALLAELDAAVEAKDRRSRNGRADPGYPACSTRDQPGNLSQSYEQV